MINLPGFFSSDGDSAKPVEPKLSDSAEGERKLMMQLQEGLLLDYAQRLEKFRKQRQALHLHVSRLQPHNQRDPALRAAAAAFDPMILDNRAQVFTLFKGDIVVVFAAKHRDEIEAALVRLRFLFADDPLLEEDGNGNDPFATWYVLANDYPAFLRLTQQVYAEQEERRRVDIERDRPRTNRTPRQTVERRLSLLTPSVLGKLEDALKRTDLSNLIRHQSVSAIVGRSRPQHMFSEVFVSISDLRDIFVPDVDITSNTWLFQHLTETLDRRVLALVVAGHDRSLSGGFSVNLNVRTILSEDFLNFDDGIAGGLRGTIVLEIQLFDILANVGAFLFARDFARERGYRICVDGVTTETLPLVDRVKIGADLIKLIWGHDLMAAHEAGDDHPLTTAIARSGRKRVVLARVDNDEQIHVGQDLGLSMFQGRGVERLIQGHATKGPPSQSVVP
ncbi:MAG: EAL domain-containing protein [Rhodospirillaceae bacterium]|nr:EAL domain-containing protein [Rhodospirillaceae bacterium]